MRTPSKLVRLATGGVQDGDVFRHVIEVDLVALVRPLRFIR
jgi:hypothetical protein